MGLRLLDAGWLRGGSFRPAHAVPSPARRFCAQSLSTQFNINPAALQARLWSEDVQWMRSIRTLEDFKRGRRAWKTDLGEVERGLLAWRSATDMPPSLARPAADVHKMACRAQPCNAMEMLES